MRLMSIRLSSQLFALFDMCIGTSVQLFFGLVLVISTGAV